MKFWKLHGIGNDFIAIDQRFNNNLEYCDLAKRVCHRKFSVGADGLLIAKKSDIADIKMIYYNSDGSKANMCGNGLRCFARFVYDNNIITKDSFKIETYDGIKIVNLNIENNIESIKVNMGKGSLLSKEISINCDSETFIEKDIKILDKTFKISAILMGVPHSVIFIDDISVDDVCKYGKEIEKNKIFNQGINVNFVKVEDDRNIKVYTWERGCGYTYACGSGMTACAIISNLLRKTKETINVQSKGGCLKIDIKKDGSYMIGPAIKICEGILEV